jgi:hypothetical protein
MTIEIHKPELEALIVERLKSGGFENVEDVLMQALQMLPSTAKKSGATGADLVAAMQASPCKDIEITPSRSHMPVRDTVL